MTGNRFADILRDADMLSGGDAAYRWVRTWQPARGIPLGIAAREAEQAAGDGLAAVWLRGVAQAFDGRYSADAAVFADAMLTASQALRASGVVVFPAAASNARDAQTFASWSASAFAGGLRVLGSAHPDERIFLPWLRAMCARYVQE